MTMKRNGFGRISVWCALGALLAGCRGAKSDPGAEAPPPALIEKAEDNNVVRVARAEGFPLATATARSAGSEMVVTGVVSPDVSRTVPVVSIATGRVTEIRARLGDTVKKGQLLMRVESADVAAAYAEYRKAVSEETLTKTQDQRAQDLYEKGAVSLNEFQSAENAENKAKLDVQSAAEHLRVLGAPLEPSSGVVDVYAPVDGVITDQQVTNASGVAGLSSPVNPFTISDLSHVWIVCDVYENDLPNVQVGETADVRLNAYPGKTYTGVIGNIGAVLDPSIRTVKIRIELKNPGMLRVGMFASATFHGQKKENRAVVPSSAVLHLHDRDWVYVPAGEKKYRRVEVVAGAMLPGNAQEIVSGVEAGQQVVSNALVLESSVEQ
jgi:cobalt-zinc-cadmium efflux system membrane fusion protein